MSTIIQEIVVNIARSFFEFVIEIVCYWTGYAVLNTISLGYMAKLIYSMQLKSAKLKNIDKAIYQTFGLAFCICAFLIGKNIYRHMHMA